MLIEQGLSDFAAMSLANLTKVEITDEVEMSLPDVLYKSCLM